MNRTLDEAAALLGLRPRAFREQLKALKVLNRDGTLGARYVGTGKLYSQLRSFQDRQQRPRHYAVVMVTEEGIAHLAKRLGIEIKAQHKDAAA